MIQIHDITNTIFNSKTYILYKERENNAWLVDIGDVEPVLEFLKEKGLSIVGIFLTHAHFDHIYGILSLMRHFPNCKIFACAYAKQALASEKMNMSRYHGTPINFESENFVVVVDGESISLYDGEPQMILYETPGHNPGCLTMVLGNVIFTGDAYIPGVGANTRLPHANKELAKISLERIFSLSAGKRILSGHQVN